MDVQELWEENKRWLLGCVAGLVIFLVADKVISGMYDHRPVLHAANAQAGKLTEEHYGASARAAAVEEAEVLEARVLELRDALEFEPAPEFRLDGERASDLVFADAQTEVNSRMVTRADVAGVDFDRSDLHWTTPVDLEGTRDTLIGLALLDEAAERLFTAHEQVRAEDPRAAGLRSVLRFSLEDDRRRQRRPRYLDPRRSPSGGGAGVEQFLREVTVELEFEADAATVMVWLESCHRGANPMALVEIELEKTANPGDPLHVVARLAAVTFDQDDYQQVLETAGQEGL